MKNLSENQNTNDKRRQKNRLPRIFAHAKGVTRDNRGYVSQGDILCIGLIIFLVIVTAPDVRKILTDGETKRIAQLQQIIAARPTLEQAEYCLPTDMITLYEKVDIDGYPKIFLCDQVNIIGPLADDYTTTLDQSGYPKTVRDGTFEEQNLDEHERCWENDTSGYVKSIYYEYGDGVYLIMLHYGISQFDDAEEAINWAKAHENRIPQCYHPVELR